MGAAHRGPSEALWEMEDQLGWLSRLITEPYSQSRDKEVTKLAKEYGVEVIPKISHTLYNIDR